MCPSKSMLSLSSGLSSARYSLYPRASCPTAYPLSEYGAPYLQVAYMRAPEGELFQPTAMLRAAFLCSSIFASSSVLTIQQRTTLSQMARCFVSRCAVGPNPADVAAAGARSTLTAYLNAAAWRRILEALCAGGLIDLLQGATTIQHFWKAMDEVVAANPANMLLTANDWEGSDPFDVVAVPRVAAVAAARGVAAAAAVPAVAADAGPAAMVFLNMADLTLLEGKDSTTQ